MKTKIVMSVIILIALAALQALPTRTITGTVTDATDGSTLAGVNVLLKGTRSATVTDAQGKYSLTIPDGNAVLVFSFIGLQNKEVRIASSDVINVALQPDLQRLNEVVVTGYSSEDEVYINRSSVRSKKASGKADKAAYGLAAPMVSQDWQQPPVNTEEYGIVNENIFQEAMRNPLSTFSIDVDAASYSNVRRFINSGQAPPKDAVRIEEMINYFHYDYKQPKGEDPFAIVTEISTAPWNKKNKLVSIGLQGKNIPTENLPASNIVFLIDVSGSMSDPNKLPLLKASFKMLIEKLREKDRVAIVVYAGAAGVVLPSTSGADKETIIGALDNLQAGGSTAGGAGIELAYAIAKSNFQRDGNNRVILATDGDFNVGESSDASMEKLIEQKRKDGIFLTVLGFGMGNYKDSKMETLADKGNGNYAYIDNIQEARKVLVSEFGGTLFTIAKDVKLQIEFNPAKVKAYRLIGYENRMLKSEDFNNDRKDAGELGSGHTVTALYEIIPVGGEGDISLVDPLKYQQPKVETVASGSPEIMTVKFRYKKPNEDVSKLIVHPLLDGGIKLEQTSDNFRWAAAVAGYGMILRESEYAKDLRFEDVLTLAKSARGKDEEGYRVEFINMVSSSQLMAKR